MLEIKPDYRPSVQILLDSDRIPVAEIEENDFQVNHIFSFRTENLTQNKNEYLKSRERIFCFKYCKIRWLISTMITPLFSRKCFVKLFGMVDVCIIG